MDASIKLRATLGEVDRAREFLRDAVADVAFSEEDLFRLELAVTEVCINIVRYAYPGSGGEMALHVWDDGDAVFVELADGGQPFDPRTVPAPTLEELVRGERTGRLGIYLARKMADTFDYRREDGRNVVTISKRISAKRQT
jgi:anti-sigma regulatory factor (Ser/Thr protein kinase)